jgi:hypothetical protein
MQAPSGDGQSETLARGSGGGKAEEHVRDAPWVMVPSASTTSAKAISVDVDERGTLGRERG